MKHHHNLLNLHKTIHYLHYLKFVPKAIMVSVEEDKAMILEMYASTCHPLHDIHTPLHLFFI